jgi:hypothetical protein
LGRVKGEEPVATNKKQEMKIINFDEGRNADWIRIVRDRNDAKRTKKTKKKFVKELAQAKKKSEA